MISQAKIVVHSNLSAPCSIFRGFGNKTDMAFRARSTRLLYSGKPSNGPVLRTNNSIFQNLQPAKFAGIDYPILSSLSCVKQVTPMKSPPPARKSALLYSEGSRLLKSPGPGDCLSADVLRGRRVCPCCFQRSGGRVLPQGICCTGVFRRACDWRVHHHH